LRLVLTTCVIRPWRRGDEESLVRHANNRNVWLKLRDLFPHPYTREDAIRWIGYASLESPLTDFAVELEGEAAGGIGLKLQTDVHRRSAEIGYWLGEPFWGRGIMTEAVREFTAWGFSQFDLCRIYAHVFDCNPASGRVLEKAGYEFEGRHRKSVIKAGETLDQLVYAVVR
jgi:RimJ/RimL family protein N-acetyltransferase